MGIVFKRIGLMGKSNGAAVKSSFESLIHFFSQHSCSIQVEESCSNLVSQFNLPILPLAQLCQQSELILVIGGDGSLLKAARGVVSHQVAVVGINRGRKGF
jgi:NAD+ kinase